MKQITRRQSLCHLEEESGRADDLHPLLRRIYENRNVRSRKELDYSLTRLLSPAQLKGIQAATALLQKAIQEDHAILIIGDYDTDGATATAVAVLGLRALGATRVNYLAPNRFEFGYGLSPEIAEVALKTKIDSAKNAAANNNLVITVDNGIASIQGVARLRAAGVAVLVTDHHLAGDELPAANAIVNPNQPGCNFPSKALCGVGVLFYLLLSVRTALRAAGHFDRVQFAEPNLADLLDLVALGTVADLVPLDYNNRILVACGVARVRAGRCRPGIKAILEVAGKQWQNLLTSDFGFVVGPRLNAAGRMDDISTGIECLLADDSQTAMKYARRLDEINRERRQVQQSMQEQATQIVARLEQRNDRAQRAGWCLFDPTWHQGVVGLVATRIREQSNQPAIAFAPADDGWLRGSARSVTGLHIRDLLESISTRCPGVIEKFGGHAMAAGLTIAAENFAVFSTQFDELVSAHFKNSPPDCNLLTDGELTSDDLTLETAELVRAASPWGQQFPMPLFDGEFHVIAQRIVGHGHLKMTIAPLGDAATELDAILFRYLKPDEEAPPLHMVKVAYQLQVNEFRGRKSLQLLVEYMQPSADELQPQDAS